MSTESIRFRERLLTKLGSFNESNEEWKTFVHDHKENILANSTIVTLDPDTIAEYIYQPDLYLFEIQNIEQKYTWIFLFINNLTSYTDFDTLLTEIYIPKTEYIDELLFTFMSVIAAGLKR